MITDQQIQTFRQETPGTAHYIHLNNAGAAFMPQPVIEAVQNYIQLEAIRGGYESMAQEATAIEGFYVSTAKLLNTKPQNIAFTASATDSYNKAISAIPFKEGATILTTRQDYASNQIAFLQLQKSHGIKVVHAHNHTDGTVNLNSFEELMKKHQPQLVAVTHVPTNSGLVQPVIEIGALCKKQDTLYIVDACQSVGQMQVDLEELHCDFLSVTMRKFLRGPRGAGFLYASDRILDTNMEAKFMDLKACSWTAPDQYQLASTAQRFELWERSYALMLGSKAAIDYALNIGMSQIEARIKHLASLIRARLEAIPQLKVLDQGKELCGIVTFTSDTIPQEKICSAIEAAKINFSTVPYESALIDFIDKQVKGAIRISPHYYNTETEIDTLMEAIQSSII